MRQLSQPPVGPRPGLEVTVTSERGGGGGCTRCLSPPVSMASLRPAGDALGVRWAWWLTGQGISEAKRRPRRTKFPRASAKRVYPQSFGPRPPFLQQPALPTPTLIPQKLPFPQKDSFLLGERVSSPTRQPRYLFGRALPLTLADFDNTGGLGQMRRGS